MKEVSGSFPDFFIYDSVAGRNVIVNSRIHEDEFESVLFAQEIDTGSSLGEMTELLPCDFFGRDAYPFFENPVVCREQNVVRIVNFRGKCLLYEADLVCQFLQTT